MFTITIIKMASVIESQTKENINIYQITQNNNNEDLFLKALTLAELK